MLSPSLKNMEELWCLQRGRTSLGLRTQSKIQEDPDVKLNVRDVEELWYLQRG